MMEERKTFGKKTFSAAAGLNDKRSPEKMMRSLLFNSPHCDSIKTQKETEGEEKKIHKKDLQKRFEKRLKGSVFLFSFFYFNLSRISGARFTLTKTNFQAASYFTFVQSWNLKVIKKRLITAATQN